MFAEETRARAQEIIARYPVGKERSALLPLLHLVQSEQGYVSSAGISFCAELLGLTRVQVAEVASFHTMFKRRPTGDWLVSVCTNPMCAGQGGERTFRALREHLGIDHGETTEDGSITLEQAECLAACDHGPVLTVNYEFFDQVQAEQALEIVQRLQRGERPRPSRGAGLCTFREISRQLAGCGDEPEDAVAAGGPSEATLAGAKLAQQHGICVAGFDPEAPIKQPAPARPGHEPPESAPRPAADRKPADEPPPAAGRSQS